MRREYCGSCGSTGLETFLQLNPTPLANTYPKTLGDEKFYPLELGVCKYCNLVQLMDVVPDSEIYTDEYGFYSGASRAQLTYHENIAQVYMSRFKNKCAQGVYEVACNDGSLLQHFQKRGYRTLGIDPSAGPVSVARDKGLTIIDKGLNSEIAREVIETHGYPGLVIANNTLAHVENLIDVISGLKILMNHDTLAVIEMQYFPDMFVGNMYDQVYHEHRYFYSLTSFKNVTSRCGLRVVDAELIEFQNGGLRVTLSTSPLVDVNPRVYDIIMSEQWLTSSTNMCAYNTFQGKVNRTRDHFLSVIDKAFNDNWMICGYTASAKATTIVHFCGLDLPYIIDTTPHKQGRYLPGTNIRIESPDTMKNVNTDSLAMVLLSSNYLGTLLKTHPHTGAWITSGPLPMMV